MTNHPAMIHSYFATAARSLRKNKFHSLINIGGLAIGIMASVMALMFVLDEFSFDQFQTKKDRLYRLNKIAIEPNGSSSQNAESCGLMGAAMVSEFPEVEKVVRYLPWDETLLTYHENNLMIREGDLAFVDSTFFDLFDFKLLEGDARTALIRPNTMVLTPATATALFGETDPIGKTIIGIGGVDFEITGIVAAPPRTSHIQYAGLMSWTTTQQTAGPLAMEWMNNWITQGICTYVLVKSGADITTLQSHFPALMKSHIPTRIDRYKPYLQPFGELYLKSNNVSGTRMSRSGSLSFVYMFSIVAVFILVIACINYINISTSRATRRAREVGMRKTMGAGKWQLITQFLGESFVLVLSAGVIGVALLYFGIPFFNDLAGKTLSLSLLANYKIVGGILLIIGITGLTAGIYPAFIISAFAPAEVLRSAVSNRTAGGWRRHTLITFQFFVSIVIISCTLLVYEQVHYVLSKDLGFDKGHILVLNLTGDLVKKREVLAHEINSFPGVESSSLARTALGNGTASTYVIPEGFPPDEVEVRMFPVDCDFLNTYGLQMNEGNFFRRFSASDSNGFIINETLARKLKWEDPLKKTIRFEAGDPARPVIGVIKDFNFMSLYDEIQPVLMWVSKRPSQNLSIRYRGNPSELLTFLEGRWKQYEARYPFSYYFVDQAFAKSYEGDQKLLKTVVAFAVLSIVIACLGLYGLVSYTLEQRTKEFGIRKVLGATVSGLTLTINKKFVWMVLVAGAISLPVVIPLVNAWLAHFAYRIDVGTGSFLLATLMTLTVTTIAISLHAFRIAKNNPAQSLRNE